MKTLNILLVLFFLTACGKDEETITTIEGQLMASCDVPAANTSGFILTNDGLLSGPGISLSFTTDENGYFKVSHRGKANQLNSFTVRVQGSSDVLKVPGLPGDNKNLGKVYINPFPTNFIIKLDVRNAYTENDTLVMMDYSSSDPFANRLIAGPFTNGVLDTIFNHTHTLFPIRFSEITTYGGPRNAVTFRLRSLPNFIGTQQMVNFYIAPICSGEFAEVTLVID
jgi:hypothetical protein